MTEKLYLHDAYLRETGARVVSAGDGRVVLDRTIFYAEKGGQGADRGEIRHAEGAARVVGAEHEGEDVVHAVEGALPPEGAEVSLRLDWPRRYGFMRNHTAAHVLCGVVWRAHKSLSVGGQLYPDKGRLDFLFDAWRPEMKAEIEAEANAVVAKDHEVVNRWIPREAFTPDLLRTKEDLLDPSWKEIRLTDIVGYDVQADGGTHVRRLAEVGRIRLGKVENKGKGVRRLEWTLDGP